MSRKEKINKMIEEIKIRRNDEQYRGGPFFIYHIEFDILNKEIERLNNIIKRLENEISGAYTDLSNNLNVNYMHEALKKDLLAILDKVNNKE